jgi:hypothetical protein
MVMDKIVEELRRIRWLLTLSLVLSAACLAGLLWLMVEDTAVFDTVMSHLRWGKRCGIVDPCCRSGPGSPPVWPAERGPSSCRLQPIDQPEDRLAGKVGGRHG